MDKPFTVAHEDFKQDLADLINNSGLPALVIEPILQSYLNETRLVAANQYKRDKALYEKEKAKNDRESKAIDVEPIL